MKISVLTPSLNYGHFLRDAIASVTLQHETPPEHVVADGGSTDDTVSVLKSAPPHVRWVSEADRGQSDALTKAFHISTGDWIGWLNADEFYLPGALDAVERAIGANPAADVVYGDFAFVDSPGTLLRLVPEHRYSSFVLRYYSNFIPSCATFIRRGAMPARLWDRECRSLMDWDLFLELGRQRSRFIHLQRPLAAFRIHSGQVTSSPVAQTPAEFRLIRRRHGIPTSALALMPATVVGYLGHAWLKALDGSYRRQGLALRRLRAANLRWFADADGNENARRLLAEVYSIP
jgi:glycosyltransferase involved in cell wall biosynthesis